MKTFHSFLCGVALCATFHYAAAQGTAFTYQGQLSEAGAPANGSYNLQFSLFQTNAAGAPIAGPLTNSVAVSNGLFTVALDFGPGVFTGQRVWIEVGARTNGAATFAILSPRQQITPAPTALYAPFAGTAGSIASSNILGVLTPAQLPAAAVTNNEAGVTLTNATLAGSYATLPGTIVTGGLLLSYENAGSSNYFAGPGAGFTSWLSGGGTANTGIGESALAAATAGNNTAIGALALTSNTTGPDNTAAGANALANNTNGFANTAVGSSALLSNRAGFGDTGLGYQALGDNVGGAYNTAVGSGALFANVNGAYNTAEGAGALQSNTNSIYNSAFGYAALLSDSSGVSDTAGGAFSLYSLTNANQNTAYGVNTLFYLLNGGGNIALGFNAGYAFHGGESNNIDIGNLGVLGDNNIIRIGSPGIHTNTILAGVISGNGGGLTNLSVAATSLPSDVSYLDADQTFSGYNTFASSVSISTGPDAFPLLVESSSPIGAWLGLQNTSTNGDVWDLISTGSGNGEGAGKLLLHEGSGGNTIMTLQSNGCVGIGVTSPAYSLQVNNAFCDGNVWHNASDRNLKENFAPVDALAVLAKVTSLPILTWNYKTQPEQSHLGPVAQDFKSAFQLGADDRHIASVDEEGVALAAIQGLNQKLEAQVKDKDARITDLERRLAVLESLARGK